MPPTQQAALTLGLCLPHSFIDGRHSAECGALRDGIEERLARLGCKSDGFLGVFHDVLLVALPRLPRLPRLLRLSGLLRLGGRLQFGSAACGHRVSTVNTLSEHTLC